jgi:hypothetical protein
MLRGALSLLLATLFAAAAHAQSAPGPQPRPTEEQRRACAEVPMFPNNGRELAQRAECVLNGALPSNNRLVEARLLARGAMNAGEAAGGLLLYLIFQTDPANQYIRDSKVDLDAYRRLAARSLSERKEQVDAIEALGFAAGQGHAAAGVLLINYFHDTVAPQNVSRVGALAALLARNGERGPELERFAREADAISKNARATKASVRSFLEGYRAAANAAAAGYRDQTGGKSCDKAQLKSVSSGEIDGAEYLPLKGTMVADSYLVKGRWAEYWTFQACDQEVPVKVTFQADGWGGSTFTAVHNKGG